MIKTPYRWFNTAKQLEVKAHNLWNEEHVDRNASNIRDALFGCEYIIEVSWRKIFHKGTNPNHWVLASWVPEREFIEQYMYPHRKLGDHCVIIEMRGIHDHVKIYERNEFGTDGVFIGTNISEDAVMIALKYK